MDALFLLSGTKENSSSTGFLFRAFTKSYENKLKKDVSTTDHSHRWGGYILQQLAFAMMQRKTVTEIRLSIDRVEAEQITANYLRGKVEYHEEIARLCLEDLLRYHLIQIGNQGSIEFRHQRIQEYYAAEWLLSELPNISDDRLIREFLNQLKWTESVKMALGLIDNQQETLRVVRLALFQVDTTLGATLIGTLKPSFQQHAIKYIRKLDLPGHVTIWPFPDGDFPVRFQNDRDEFSLLTRTRCDAAISYLLSTLIISRIKSNKYYASV